MKKLTKIVTLELIGFAVSVAPLLVVLISRWDRYVNTSGGAFRLTFGLIIILLFALLKAIGKLKMPRRVFVFATVSALAWLMESVLNDLSLLAGMAFVGEMLDIIIVQPLIRKEKEKQSNERLATAIGEAIGGDNG